MNFEAFTSRVTASAALVTDAARSFNNLDQMASQDEYVHSPDLKLSRESSSVPSRRQNQKTTAPQTTNEKNSTNTVPMQQPEQEELETFSRSSSVADELHQQRLEQSSAVTVPMHDRFDHHESGNDTWMQQSDSTTAAAATTSQIASLSSTRPNRNQFLSTHSLPEEYKYNSTRPPTAARADDMFSTISRSPPKRQTTMPLLSVVSDLMKDNQNKKETTTTTTGKDSSLVQQQTKHHASLSTTGSRQSSRHSTTTNTPYTSGDDSSDSDDDSDADEYDPVIDMIKAEKKTAKTKVQESALEEKAMREISKNPNRFNEGLDYRMSLPEQPQVQLQQDEEIGRFSSVCQTLEHTPSFVESTNKWEWVKTMTSSRVNQILVGGNEGGATTTTSTNQREMTPLTAHLSRNKQNNEHGLAPDPNENFQVVVSSSILGADEQAELDRLRQASTASADPFSTALKFVERKPQFVAVGVIFVLVVAMYFWMGERVVKAESELN